MSECQAGEPAATAVVILAEVEAHVRTVGSISYDHFYAHRDTGTCPLCALTQSAPRT